MKCIERIILQRLLPVCLNINLESRACKNCSVDDATITMLNCVYQRLDKPGTYVRALFVQYRIYHHLTKGSC